MPDVGTDKPSTNYTSEELTRFVESALGARAVQIGPGPEVQIQHIDASGRVVRVRPGRALELEMFNMLCTPQTEWPVAAMEDGGE